MGEIAGSVYTGYYEVDWVRVENGWQVCWTQHQWVEKACACGHVTRAIPWREQVEGTELGGFRLIGPGLAGLIVALALRYRLSRPRIREFLGEWLGVWLSVGAIHAVLDEVGELMAPVEAELIEAVQASGLLQADETPWPEQGHPGSQPVAVGLHGSPGHLVLPQPPWSGTGSDLAGGLCRSLDE